MGQKSRTKKQKNASSNYKLNNQISQVASPVVLPRQKASILSPSAHPTATQGYKSSMNSTQKAAIFNNMDYVRGDIIRILLLLVIMALILASFAILNVKSSVLTTAGQHFSTFMHLQ